MLNDLYILAGYRNSYDRVALTNLYARRAPTGHIVGFDPAPPLHRAKRKRSR
jgi:hypothetical protein